MDYGNACAGLDDEALQELSAIASLYREAGGLIVKLSDMLGEKVDDAIKKVPEEWQAHVQDAADMALRSAYLAASSTQADEGSVSYLNRALARMQGERWHKVAAGCSGAIGGAGGLVTTAADLAATTVLIMRSLQEIAASYGEDVSSEEVRVACISVFGFGGPLTEDDEVDSGLIGVRIALASRATLEAVLKIVLPRFGLMASQKLLAQAVPLLGAFAGATINPAFTAYYQQMGHVHFRLRRLEAEHDAQQINACFARIVAAQRRDKVGTISKVDKRG